MTYDDYKRLVEDHWNAIDQAAGEDKVRRFRAMIEDIWKYGPDAMRGRPRREPDAAIEAIFQDAIAEVEQLLGPLDRYH